MVWFVILFTLLGNKTKAPCRALLSVCFRYGGPLKTIVQTIKPLVAGSRRARKIYCLYTWDHQIGVDLLQKNIHPQQPPPPPYPILGPHVLCLSFGFSSMAVNGIHCRSCRDGSGFCMVPSSGGNGTVPCSSEVLPLNHKSAEAISTLLGSTQRTTRPMFHRWTSTNFRPAKFLGCETEVLCTWVFHETEPSKNKKCARSQQPILGEMRV